MPLRFDIKYLQDYNCVVWINCSKQTLILPKKMKGTIIMKAFKTFIITLCIVLALGGLVLLNRANVHSLLNSMNTESTDSSSAAGSSKKKSSANPVTKAIVSEALDTYLEHSDGKVKEISESITEEDKDAVAEIIADNVSLDTISDVKDLIGSGDKEALAEYAEDNLSEEDQEQLKEILSKYVTEP